MKDPIANEMLSIMVGLHKTVAKRKRALEVNACGRLSDFTASSSESDRKRRKNELFRDEVPPSLAVVLTGDVADETYNCKQRRFRYLESMQNMGIDKNATCFIDAQSGFNSFAYKNWPQLQLNKEIHTNNCADFVSRNRSTPLVVNHAPTEPAFAPKVFDIRTFGNSLKWEERLPLCAAASNSGLQALRQPAPCMLRVVEQSMQFLGDKSLRMIVGSSGRSMTRIKGRGRQQLLEEAAGALADQGRSPQEAEAEVHKLLARRLEALADATLHMVMAHTAAAASEEREMPAEAASGSLGWKHVLQQLQQLQHLQLPWPDNLPPAGSILSDQLLQRVARRLQGIFVARKP